MMVSAAVALILSAASAAGQTFAVATIKPSQGKAGDSGLSASPGTLTIRNLPLRMIIGAAYGIAEYQIAGPPWLKEQRFDIVAKTDAPVANQEEILPLLRPLLAERFRLAMHQETRELPAYILLVARNGPKMETADSPGAAIPFKKANKSNGTRVRSPNLTMPQLADILSRRLGQPVRDMTGLSGGYRVTLEWAADEKVSKPGRTKKPGKTKRDSDLPTIFTALQNQLGLRLDSRKAPVDIFVIDHVEKTPAGN
jgi:uncharacterized protein (TIGR03435 family)